MEDLQEYEQVKKLEKRKLEGTEETAQDLGTQIITSFRNRLNKEIVYERIGYNPAPRNPLWPVRRRIKFRETIVDVYSNT